MKTSLIDNFTISLLTRNFFSVFQNYHLEANMVVMVFLNKYEFAPVHLFLYFLHVFLNFINNLNYVYLYFICNLFISTYRYSITLIGDNCIIKNRSKFHVSNG